MVDFNKPYLTGKEVHYIYEAVNSHHISGNGIFTKKCQSFFVKKYGFNKCLLTSSCTDSLEMAAILLDIRNGDEVIVPTYTFVSTANAFVLRGAKIIFADSSPENPNIDVNSLEALISPHTKAIVPIHYAGIACDMDKIISIAAKYGIFVVEDAAQAINSFYKGRPLGSIGNLASFSFHETKNVISGEGGMLVVNDDQFSKRADIIWEKGTNRVEFFRGAINKYEWVDIGSSFLSSDIIAAFLYAQLEDLEDIQKKRLQIWNFYHEGLKTLEEQRILRLPFIPDYATNNAHIFYILCKNKDERDALIEFLKNNGITVVFHYLPLHRSAFYKNKHDGRELSNSEIYSNCLVRLPMFYELTQSNQCEVIDKIFSFYKSKLKKKENRTFVSTSESDKPST